MFASESGILSSVKTRPLSSWWMHVHASQAAFSVPMVQFLEQSKQRMRYRILNIHLTRQISESKTGEDNCCSGKYRVEFTVKHFLFILALPSTIWSSDYLCSVFHDEIYSHPHQIFWAFFTKNLHIPGMIDNSCWKMHLPGHFHSAHNLIWSDFPAQEIGAKTALSLMATHALFRYRVPVPHVLVQSLQGLQRDHLDSKVMTYKISC